MQAFPRITRSYLVVAVGPLLLALGRPRLGWPVAGVLLPLPLGVVRVLPRPALGGT